MFYKTNNVYVYVNDVQICTSSRADNINSFIDSINRNFVRINSLASANGLIF